MAFWCCPSHALGISLDRGKKNPTERGAVPAATGESCSKGVQIERRPSPHQPAGGGEGHAGRQAPVSPSPLPLGSDRGVTGPEAQDPRPPTCRPTAAAGGRAGPRRSLRPPAARSAAVTPRNGRRGEGGERRHGGRRRPGGRCRPPGAGAGAGEAEEVSGRRGGRVRAGHRSDRLLRGSRGEGLAVRRWRGGAAAASLRQNGGRCHGRVLRLMRWVGSGLGGLLGGPTARLGCTGGRGWDWRRWHKEPE